MFNELKRNISDTGSSRGNSFLASLYSDLGEYDKALELFLLVEKSANLKVSEITIYSGLAYIYSKLNQFENLRFIYSFRE